MGSLLNKHSCDPDSEDSGSKSRRVTWRNVGKNNSRTSSDPDVSPRLKRRVSKYMLSKYDSKYRAGKRLRHRRLRLKRYDRDAKKPRRRYRSRSRARRRGNSSSVGKRRNRRRSEQRQRKRSDRKIARRGPGRKRKRGRPRKNVQSRVYGRRRRNSVAKRRGVELTRYKRDSSRDRRSDVMREVSARQDAQRMFKPPDKVKRKVYDKGVDDIQENPLSVRRRCSLLVSSIPGIPFDGRKRDEKKSDRIRNEAARVRNERRRYLRRHSNNRRKPRKTSSLTRRCRKTRVYRDRNRNAVESLPRLTNQITYWQTGAGEYCRPQKLQSISSHLVNCQRMCHKFVCPCSRRGVDSSRSLSRCCCRISHFGTKRDEAADISPEGCCCCCCCHCYMLTNLITKRGIEVNSRRGRKTNSRRLRQISNPKPDSIKNTI